MSGRYHTLDGLRGFAAIAVMLFHLHDKAPLAMPGGYLAVDLFFALSGFVLSSAYEHRLRGGMGIARFATLRLIRVYPMFLIGALLGIAIKGGSLVALLPFPVPRASNVLFPDNGPMWSLFLELVVNLAFAAALPVLGKRALAATLAVSGTILAGSIVTIGHADLGAFDTDFVPALARTIFSFGVGVAIFRLRSALAVPTGVTWKAWLLPPILLAAMMAAPANRTFWDLAGIFAIMPALVWAGAAWQAPPSKMLGWLGDLSFPLYCIQDPLTGHMSGPWGLVAGQCLAVIAAAFWLDRRIDRPVRAWLTARHAQRTVTAVPA